MDFCGFDLICWREFLLSYDFGLAFLPELLATFLGVVLGVWGALWVNGRQEKHKRLEEIQEEKDRKEKILTLIKEELYINLDWLDMWKEDPEGETALFLLGMLRDNSWNALSDGGELQWIKDPELIGYMADAYSGIGGVKALFANSSDLILIPDRRVAHRRRVMKNLKMAVDYASDFSKDALGEIYRILYDKDFSKELEILNKS